MATRRQARPSAANIAPPTAETVLAAYYTLPREQQEKVCEVLWVDDASWICERKESQLEFILSLATQVTELSRHKVKPREVERDAEIVRQKDEENRTFLNIFKLWGTSPLHKY